VSDRRRLHRLLMLYPPSFRRRYRAELEALVDEIGLPPRAAVDLAVGAGPAWLRHVMRRMEEPLMIRFASQHPQMLAMAAALLLVPAGLVVVGSLLAYELAVPGVVGWVQPMMEAIATVRPLDLLIVVAPAIALIAAILPLVSVGVERRGSDTDAASGTAGSASLVVGVRLLWSNLVIAFAAMAIGGVLVGHIVIEAVFEAGR
jgi:hypothetical protein